MALGSESPERVPWSQVAPNQFGDGTRKALRFDLNQSELSTARYFHLMRYLTIEQRESLHAQLNARAESLREEIARALRQADGPRNIALGDHLDDVDHEAAAHLEAHLGVEAFQRYLDELREVEQGLVHLHAPEYGICAACSAEISYSRLSVNPAATRCARCQVLFEHGWPRTAERTF